MGNPTLGITIKTIKLLTTPSGRCKCTWSKGRETMCASYNIWLISWTCLARQLLQLQFAYESFQSRCPNWSWNQSPRHHKEDVIANLCKIKYRSKYNAMPCHIPGTEQYTPPTLFAKKKKGAYIQTFGLSLRTAETQRFGRLLSTPQTTQHTTASSPACNQHYQQDKNLFLFLWDVKIIDKQDTLSPFYR